MIALGLGARRGTSVADLRTAVDAVLAEAGLTAAEVTVLATLDRRAAEPGVRELALDLQCRLVGRTAEELAGQSVPNPSRTVAGVLRTPSVAEASALLAAGPGAGLIVPKRVFPCVTLALAAGVPGAIRRA